MGEVVPDMSADRGPAGSDDAAVRATEAAYDAAWNAGDLVALAGLLTPDVVVVNPYGEATAGRDEVELMFKALFEGAARGSTHLSQVRAVHFVSPDVALVDAEATISGFGSRDEPLRHSFTDVLVRTTHGWRIRHVRAYTFLPRPGA